MVAGLVVLAAVLRFSTLGVQSYWYDEFATVQILLQPHLQQAVHAYMHTESTPPLYYVIAWLWSRLFGTGEFALRFLSATFGTIAVPVAYLAGRRLISGRAGVLAAVLVAASPTLVWYSQEARAYGLMVLLGAVSLVFLARALDDPTRRAVGLWAVSASLALLTHYFAVFLVGAETAVIARSLRRRPSALLPAVMVPAVGLALLPLANAQGGGSHTNWIAGIPIGQRVAAITKELLSANTLVVNENTGVPSGALGYLVAVTIVLSVMATVVVVVRRRRHTGAALAVLLGSGALMVPLLLAGVHQDYLFDRNLLSAWVPLAIGLGAALTVLPRLAMVGAIIVIGAAGLITDLRIDTNPALQRSDWRDAVAVLGKQRQPRAIIVIPAYARYLVPYYGVPSAVLSYGGIVTSELDVIGNFNTAGVYPRLNGFLPVLRPALPGIGLIRLRASRPMLLTPSIALVHGIDPAEVMAEYSAGATAWLRAYALRLVRWQRALSLLDHDAAHDSINRAALSLLIDAESADRGTLLADPTDLPQSRAWTPLMFVAATRGAQWAFLLGAIRGHPSVAPAVLQSAKRFDLALRQVPGNAEVAGRLSATTVTSKLLARIP
ncbi:MAG: hypothetical protein DLM64_05245 [Solirubrobacterales bacterium]|nr:MAG: hypothetical protein DLM64_05245 [Solirubrobacterales bacterium]